MNGRRRSAGGGRRRSIAMMMMFLAVSHGFMSMTRIVQVRGAGERHGRVFVSTSARQSHQDDDDEIEVFSKKQKKKNSDEERYPYEVFETSPPQALLGVFALSKNVACGDILKLKASPVSERGKVATDDKAYVIKRVASQYKYTNGRFQLASKRADATELNREAAEKKLRRILSVSGESSS